MNFIIQGCFVANLRYARFRKQCEKGKTNVNHPKHLLNLFGDRIATLPLLVLYLTDGCNSQCATCDIWRNARVNMQADLVDELVDACADLDVRWVLLSGGEAMQHPQWPEIALRFREAGAHVMLLTNGLLLRKQTADVLRSVDEVIVSLDAGTAETYEAIRGVDAFSLVLDGIRIIRASGLPVTTRTTLQRANYAEMPAIIDAAKHAYASRISFLPVDVSSQSAFGPRFDQPGPRHNPELTLDDIVYFERILQEVFQTYAADFETGRIAESPDKLLRLLDYFRAVAGFSVYEAPRCNTPHIATVVEVDGRLRPCYFLPEYGSLRGGEGLRAVLNSQPARALRRAYQNGERAECKRCVCPLYKGPRSILKM